MRNQPLVGGVAVHEMEEPAQFTDDCVMTPDTTTVVDTNVVFKVQLFSVTVR